MSKSLQDQLRELGLAKERSSRTPGKERKPARKRPVNPAAPTTTGGGDEVSLEEAFRLRKLAEQAEASEAKRRKQEEDRRRRALNQAIKAIVEPNRQNDPEAEEARYFMYKERIRKVHVTPAQRAALNEGRLGLVYLAGGYHVLEPQHVEAVRQLSAEHVPELDPGDEEPPAS